MNAKYKDHASEYNTWVQLRHRCNSPKNKDYGRYGGRGITVCDEWNSSFSAFMSDMGDRPFDGAQIDRIDNMKGYSKSNCRWTYGVTNSRNRVTTKLSIKIAEIIREMSCRGIPSTVIAKAFGVKPVTVYSVIRKENWSKQV